VVLRRDEINLYDVFVKKFQRKSLLAKPGFIWKDIKVDCKWGVRVWSGFIGLGGGFL
jgi:hypothetical protein